MVEADVSEMEAQSRTELQFGEVRINGSEACPAGMASLVVGGSWFSLTTRPKDKRSPPKGR